MARPARFKPAPRVPRCCLTAGLCSLIRGWDEDGSRGASSKGCGRERRARGEKGLWSAAWPVSFLLHLFSTFESAVFAVAVLGYAGRGHRRTAWRPTPRDLAISVPGMSSDFLTRSQVALTFTRHPPPPTHTHTTTKAGASRLCLRICFLGN